MEGVNYRHSALLSVNVMSVLREVAVGLTENSEQHVLNSHSERLVLCWHWPAQKHCSQQSSSLEPSSSTWGAPVRAKECYRINLLSWTLKVGQSTSSIASWEQFITIPVFFERKLLPSYKNWSNWPPDCNILLILLAATRHVVTSSISPSYSLIQFSFLTLRPPEFGHVKSNLPNPQCFFFFFLMWQ